MEFWKMNGAGNDFIIVDNRLEKLSEEMLSKIALKVCHRHLSIGADGFMAVNEPTGEGDYKMLFFNSDGSMGEMCGNGARCICRYGYEKGLAGDVQKVETTAGLVTGYRIDGRNYKIRLNDPNTIKFDLELETSEGTVTGSYVELGNPGLPHAVVHVPGLVGKSFDDLRKLGRELRYHKAFPKGANVNFYDIIGEDDIIEKTYERGVEDFTWACGTGTGSVVLILTLKGEVSGDNVKVTMPGGELRVTVERDGEEIENLWLTGPTNIVAKGTITDEELSI